MYTTYTYDYLGNKLQEKSVRAYNESWPESYTQQFEYDHAGRVLKEYGVDGDFVERTYDTVGRLVSVTDVKGSKAQTPYNSSFEYDKLGRLVKETVPFEIAGSTKYETVKKHYYDRNGSIVCEQVSNNQPGSPETFTKTEFEYNSRNMLVKVTTYDGGAAENYTQYYYDSIGNKLRMYTGLSSPLTIVDLNSDPTGADDSYSETKYEYDRFSRLISMTDPLNQQESYVFDLNGNLTQKTDRNGNVTTMTYDGLGRVLTRSVVTPGGTGDSSQTFSYYKVGGVKTDSSDGYTTNYSYDELGRLIQETVPGSISKQYTYDAADNRKSFVLTKNSITEISTTYDYDKMNRLWKVYEGGVLEATYSYDDNGNRESLTYSNGNVSTYQYNLANMVTQLKNMAGGTTLSQFDYTYLLDGNQRTKTESVSGDVTTYTYDDLGRLTSEAKTGEPAVSYTFDDYSNRASMTVTGVSTTTYDYDDNNRLLKEEKVIGGNTETTRFSYDPNGNEIFRAKETLEPDGSVPDDFGIYVLGEDEETEGLTCSTYNGFNQLTGTRTGDKVIEYSYNAGGLRVSKTTNGSTTTHIWDGSNIAAELDNEGSIYAIDIRGINLIYSEDGTGNLKHFLFNAHGDVIQLTGNTGTLIKAYEYDAFGNEVSPDSADTNPFRYCGEYLDLSSGTYYLRARYYDPTIGRFLSEDTHWNTSNMIYGDYPVRNNNYQDTLGLNTYTYIPDINAIRQSSNLYAYCGNNPVIYVDSNGQIFMLITAAIGAVVGGAAGAIYSYAKTGSVTWQSVAAGAAIGGAIGLTGGAAASLLATAGSATGVTALASTSTVLSGLGFAGGAGGAVVIGQTMSRVIDKAGSIGASVYNGCAYYQNLSNMFGSKVANIIGKADNALWIINKMAQNYKIVDIGIDVNKALGNSSYTLESILTFFYKNKEIATEYFKGAF